MRNKTSNAVMLSSKVTRHESLGGSLGARAASSSQEASTKSRDSQEKTGTQAPPGGAHSFAVKSSQSSSATKIGSRRIFTPQFKLQVLASYRSDSDCKGNQRATARKYNIHRRQIQKWLQCETNLRSSVASINQNNIKHQFHNISHLHQLQQEQQQLQMSVSAAAAAAASSNLYNNNSHHSLPMHRHQMRHPPHSERHQLPLDATRVNFTLHSQAAPPSAPLSATAEENPSAASAPRIMAASNLAAVVAAAGALPAADSPSSPNMTLAAVSPLRSTATGGGRHDAAVLPAMHYHHHHQHHHQHQHQYPIPYTHASTSASATVPILTHYIPPQQQFNHYQYQPLCHLSARPQQQSSLLSLSSSSAFLSTASLPVTVSCAAMSEATKVESEVPHEGGQQAQDEGSKTGFGVCELNAVPQISASGGAILSNTDYFYKYGQHETTTTCFTEAKRQAKKKESSTAESSLLMAPMDLSVGPRRKLLPVRETVQASEHKHSHALSLSAHPSNSSCNTLMNDEDLVVDLTFRSKRRFISSSSSSSSDIADDTPSYKLGGSATTLMNSMIRNDDDDQSGRIEVAASQPPNDGDNMDEVEVDIEEKPRPSKPIKLFKPYLLDTEDQVNYTSCVSEQRDPIIWSHHPACASPNSYDSRQDSSEGGSTTFPSSPLEKYSFPATRSNFHANHRKHDPSRSQSALESPTGALSCPEGSPVSGYESSSSVYSDLSLGGETGETRETRENRETRGNTCGSSRAYSIDLKLHPICGDERAMLNRSHIQNWLDQGTSKTASVPNAASIALFI